MGVGGVSSGVKPVVGVDTLLDYRKEKKKGKKMAFIQIFITQMTFRITLQGDSIEIPIWQSYFSPFFSFFTSLSLPKGALETRPFSFQSNCAFVWMCACRTSFWTDLRVSGALIGLLEASRLFKYEFLQLLLGKVIQLHGESEGLLRHRLQRSTPRGVGCVKRESQWRAIEWRRLWFGESQQRHEP